MGEAPGQGEVWSPEGWWQGAEQVVSPNWDLRPAETPVSLVVIHGISLPPGQFGGDGVARLFTNTLDTTADPYYEQLAGVQVSAHFFIRRDGQVVQFVAVDHRAWHAGKSAWWGRERCNDFSVGIELEGVDTLPYDKRQYPALFGLLRALAARYPVVGIAGHEHVAPDRKTDPGPGFDWSRLVREFSHLEYPRAVGEAATLPLYPSEQELP